MTGAGAWVSPAWYGRGMPLPADRKKWRGMGAAAAETAAIPPLASMEVTCWGVYPGGRLPDPDACAPSLKGRAGRHRRRGGDP